MFQFRKLVAATAVFAAAMSSANANLILNGGFEEGSPFTNSNWQIGSLGSSYWDALIGSSFEARHSGRRGFSVNFDNTWWIEQSFITQANSNYALDFWLRRVVSNAPHQFTVSVDGIPLISLSNTGDFDYTNYLLLFTANDELTTLRFTFQNDVVFSNPGFWHLDDVQVDALVPEPNVWGLLVVGGLAGYSIRLNRRRIYTNF